MLNSTKIFESIISGVIIAATIAVFGILVYVPVLRSQVDDIRLAQKEIPSQISIATEPLRERIVTLEKVTADLEKKYFIIAVFLQGKVNFNVKAFLSTAVKKGLGQQQIKTAIQKLNANPKEIKNYLEKTLKFNSDEINAILSLPKTEPKN